MVWRWRRTISLWTLSQWNWAKLAILTTIYCVLWLKLTSHPVIGCLVKFWSESLILVSIFVPSLRLNVNWVSYRIESQILFLYRLQIIGIIRIINALNKSIVIILFGYFHVWEMKFMNICRCVSRWIKSCHATAIFVFFIIKLLKSLLIYIKDISIVNIRYLFKLVVVICRSNILCFNYILKPQFPNRCALTLSLTLEMVVSKIDGLHGIVVSWTISILVIIRHIILILLHIFFILPNFHSLYFLFFNFPFAFCSGWS